MQMQNKRQVSRNEALPILQEGKRIRQFSLLSLLQENELFYTEEPYREIAF